MWLSVFLGTKASRREEEAREKSPGVWLLALILFLALFKIVGGADSRALLFLSDCCKVQEHHVLKEGSEKIPESEPSPF